MAVKTFAVGELVTASDANTYLANAGLVYVKSQTVGTGVSSVTISSAFSAEYDNYRILMSGTDCSSSNQHLQIRIGGVTTSYYWAGGYVSVLGAGNGFINGNTSGDTYVPIAYTSTQTDQVAAVDVFGPFLAAPTKFIVAPTMGDSFVMWIGGAQTNSTSYSTVTILPFSGTMTGGTITIYGYRKA